VARKEEKEGQSWRGNIHSTGLGFFSFETAWRTLQGFEVMDMMRKGRLRSVEKGDIRAQAELAAELFGMVA